MGGFEGLTDAVERNSQDTTATTTTKTTCIVHIPPEEFLLSGADDFEASLKRYIHDFPLDKNVVLVHKYSDFYKLKNMEKTRVDGLRSWLHEMTNVIKVLDDPDKIDVLSDRVRTGNLVRKMCAGEGFEARGIQWPSFTETGALEGLRMPVIVKPVDACATDESHWMTLIRGNDKDNDFLYKSSENVLVQQFYEHYGVLYKVYVIGTEVIEIVARPSISSRDLSDANPVYRFNTHKFKAAEGELNASRYSEAMARLEPHRPLIVEFTRRLKSVLGLTWFGVDIIIPEEEEAEVKVAVIDVNYMPGYDGIRELPDKLINAIIE